MVGAGNTKPLNGPAGMTRLIRAATALVGTLAVVGKTLPQEFACGRQEEGLMGMPDQELADEHGVFSEVAGRQVYHVHWPALGPTLVLIHGFGTSSSSWHAVGPLFAEAGYNTYALDLAGFGLSCKRWDAGYSHVDQANLVAAWMRQLDLAPAIVVGHSMGGNVAAHLALRHPQLVDRLVLEAAAILSGVETAGRRVGQLLNLPPLRRAARLAVREMVKRSDFSAFEARNPQVMRTLKTADWDQALLAVVRDSWANRLSHAQVRQINTPTLLIWGAEDTTIPVADVGRLQALLPRARAVIMRGVGHLPHEEDPERFVQGVVERVEAIEPKRRAA
jgi:pimeloyl-ACP methyl ester carboxylesterase